MVCSRATSAGALERRKPLTPKQREEALPASAAHEPAGPPGSNALPGGVPGPSRTPSGPQGSRQPGKPGAQGPTHGAGKRHLTAARAAGLDGDPVGSDRGEA